MSTLILRTTARLATPVIVLLSVYLLLRGHDAPGGGFIAALVAGAAIVLRFLADGGQHRRSAAGSVLIGAGLLLAGGMGLAGVALGGQFLEGAVVRWEVPGLGTLKLTASLAFDVGVYLVVLGTVAAVVSHLGEDHR